MLNDSIYMMNTVTVIIIFFHNKPTSSLLNSRELQVSTIFVCSEPFVFLFY
jgi:hypothetical protein